MSSQRRSYPLDGVLHRDDRVVGAMRLPEEEPERFLREFNRRYRVANLVVEKSDLPERQDDETS